MKALVSGATGFIGSRLCKELIQEGYAVRALVLPGEDVDYISDNALEIVFGDLLNPASIAGVSDGIDLVFHLAGRVTDWGSKDDFYAPILEGTRNLLNECNALASRFVYVSSIAACGLGEHLKGRKEDEIGRKSGVPYNDAKLDAEKLVWAYHGMGKTDCTVVRPANVIGPGSVWVKDIIERYQSTGVCVIDHGRHSASLVYVDNLVHGIILAATMDIARGKTYHFRDDWIVTWDEYLTDLGAIIGKKPLFSMPFALTWHLGYMLELVLTPLGIRPPITRLLAGVTGRNNDVDTTRARQELTWSTKVSYDEAMGEIRRWILDNINAT